MSSRRRASRNLPAAAQSNDQPADDRPTDNRLANPQPAEGQSANDASQSSVVDPADKPFLVDDPRLQPQNYDFNKAADGVKMQKTAVLLFEVLRDIPRGSRVIGDEAFDQAVKLLLNKDHFTIAARVVPELRTPQGRFDIAENEVSGVTKMLIALEKVRPSKPLVDEKNLAERDILVRRWQHSIKYLMTGGTGRVRDASEENEVNESVEQIMGLVDYAMRAAR